MANVPEMDFRGNIPDHEYKIETGREKVAEVSKRWFRIRDTYGVEIEPERIPSVSVFADSPCLFRSIFKFK